MDATKPYEFIGFGAMDVTKPYEIYKVWGHGCHQTLYIYVYIFIGTGTALSLAVAHSPNHINLWGLGRWLFE